jgi:phage minor structural protein
MRKSYVTVYDVNMRKVAMLENASTIGYEQPMNGLHTARFTLPANDPKNAECLPMRFVELYDDDGKLDLFRIMPNTARKSSDGGRIIYECEHVLGTLLDDVLFQFHTIGGLGVYTRDVLEYILSKQTVKRWKLGTVAFSRQFEYTWENEKLLNALRSVPGPFVEEFMWTWDTSTYPWTLNLVEPPNEVDAYIRYGVNMQGIERQIDPRNLCTRLYGLGYGEGVNQLTFAEINNGKPYLDADTQDQFGIISDIFVDRRFEHPETLKARCEAILNERKMPRITYTVQVADISLLTDTPLHKFRSGGKVRVIDNDLGIDVVARVVNVRKRDMRGQPGEVELEISNKPVDVAGLFNELETKQRINDLYAQGATNFDSHDFADNCDPEHPAVLRFYIPEETARINKVRLSYRVEPFRAYSKAIAGGGGVNTTTAAGGGVNTTTAAGGGTTTTTAAGGGTVVTSESDSYEESPSYKTGGVFGNPYLPTDNQGWHYHIVDPINNVTDYDGDHYHFLEDDHYHYQTLIPHTHDVVVPDHVHVLVLQNHTHQITINDHTHQITLAPHTHDIEYGIFEGPTPTTVTVRVDGNVISGLGVSADEVDIVPYLSKEAGGKIERGTWHTIEITPDSLGRIVASVVTQIFVQSRGGGDY